jgi:PHP family Zn ribbon phosphoesterase
MFCYCDFHIHSCLSPCGQPEMTPSNIARMAALQGYNIIAVSDHNTTGNCRAVIRAAAEAGIVAIPAMELTTSEEVHMLCLLPSADAADEFGKFVYERLPDIRNEPGFFGEQILMDFDDNILGYEERLLINATDISLQDVPALLAVYGGVAIPAHIDRSSFSILSNLGYIDRSLGFRAVEISRGCDPRILLENYPELDNMPYYKNSDAHDLYSMLTAKNGLELVEITAEEIIDIFKRGDVPNRLK